MPVRYYNLYDLYLYEKLNSLIIGSSDWTSCCFYIFRWKTRFPNRFMVLPL